MQTQQQTIWKKNNGPHLKKKRDLREIGSPKPRLTLEKIADLTKTTGLKVNTL